MHSNSDDPPRLPHTKAEVTESIDGMEESQTSSTDSLSSQLIPFQKDSQLELESLLDFEIRSLSSDLSLFLHSSEPSQGEVPSPESELSATPEANPNHLTQLPSDVDEPQTATALPQDPQTPDSHQVATSTEGAVGEGTTPEEASPEQVETSYKVLLPPKPLPNPSDEAPALQNNPSVSFHMASEELMLEALLQAPAEALAKVSLAQDAMSQDNHYTLLEVPALVEILKHAEQAEGGQESIDNNEEDSPSTKNLGKLLNIYEKKSMDLPASTDLLKTRMEIASLANLKDFNLQNVASLLSPQAHASAEDEASPAPSQTFEISTPPPSSKNPKDAVDATSSSGSFPSQPFAIEGENPFLTIPETPVIGYINANVAELESWDSLDSYAQDSVNKAVAQPSTLQASTPHPTSSKPSQEATDSTHDSLAHDAGALASKDPSQKEREQEVAAAHEKQMLPSSGSFDRFPVAEEQASDLLSFPSEHLTPINNPMLSPKQTMQIDWNATDSNGVPLVALADILGPEESKQEESRALTSRPNRSEEFLSSSGSFDSFTLTEERKPAVRNGQLPFPGENLTPLTRPLISNQQTMQIDWNAADSNGAPLVSLAEVLAPEELKKEAKENNEPLDDDFPVVQGYLSSSTGSESPKQGKPEKPVEFNVGNAPKKEEATPLTSESAGVATVSAEAKKKQSPQRMEKPPSQVASSEPDTESRKLALATSVEFDTKKQKKQDPKPIRALASPLEQHVHTTPPQSRPSDLGETKNAPRNSTQRNSIFLFALLLLLLAAFGLWFFVDFKNW